ncbi:Acyltransferase family protein [Caballeronia terrestris]|uniref:Acyltransferase family protein n=1 Tax=Caballeronia terrestris TaxID=1226301 RepID=A0A158KTW0_9BURK|nr:acyltransferase [Caballeronia terrestris]SAL84169.1 Acyltransferase family protein [Caballeronia terrestris]
MSANKRLFWLDFVRSISVLMIIVYHYRSQYLYQYPNTRVAGSIGVLHIGFGDLGVALFIMISGAALMITYPGKIDLADYLKKRFLSIYPGFWVAFIAASIFCLILNKHLNDTGEYWKLLFSVAAMDGFFLYKTSNYYVIGEWFLGFIIFLYLLFPLVRPVVQRYPLLALLIVPAVYLVALPIYNAQHFELIDQRNPLMRLPELVFGMMFVRFGLSHKKWLVVLAALAIAWLELFPISVSPLFYMFLIGAIFFCLFAAGAELLPVTPRLESAVGFISKYSFLAFLIHHQIIYAFFGRLDLTRASVLESYALCALIIVLSFAGAVVLQPLAKKVADVLRAALYRQPATRTAT